MSSELSPDEAQHGCSAAPREASVAGSMDKCGECHVLCPLQPTAPRGGHEALFRGNTSISRIAKLSAQSMNKGRVQEGFPIIYSE
jgi:hypothetical protein